MSLTFTKLFSSITESTVWCEPSSTRIVWITMLAMADSHGRVWASIPGLANRARVSIDECEAALQTFFAPDPYSRTPDNEGRRIEAIDGGWRLLNHGKYRAIRDEESAKESKRRYINARREEERKAAEGVEQSRTQSNSVDRSIDNAEADAEADTEDQKRPTVLSSADADDQSQDSQAKGEPQKRHVRRKRDDSTLTDWLANLEGPAVLDDDPIWAYAQPTGIPDDAIAIAWEVFKDCYATKPKKYKDWLAAFRDHVKGNYLKLWFFDQQGAFRLTPAGIQAKRVSDGT